MASTKDPNTDVSHHATAIARWEEEGGATKPSLSQTRPEAAKNSRGSPRE